MGYLAHLVLAGKTEVQAEVRVGAWLVEATIWETAILAKIILQ